MRAVVQRVLRARVSVGGQALSEIGQGMLVLLGVARGDGPQEARRLAERIARFRFFADEHGRMNCSALDCAAAALVVSQFTLCADGRDGRRPSFDAAAPSEQAEALYQGFVSVLDGLGLTTRTGRFGARMEVELVNDGPGTFVLDEPPGGEPGARSGAPPRAGEPPQVLS